MVYEALSSGAPVGVIEMQRQDAKKDKVSRVARGLGMLVQDGFVSTFTTWATENKLPEGCKVLNEAGRTADFILDKFPHLIS